jgi:hypothetical protein
MIRNLVADKGHPGVAWGRTGGRGVPERTENARAECARVERRTTLGISRCAKRCMSRFVAYNDSAARISRHRFVSSLSLRPASVLDKKSRWSARALSQRASVVVQHTFSLSPPPLPLAPSRAYQFIRIHPFLWACQENENLRMTSSDRALPFPLPLSRCESAGSPSVTSPCAAKADRGAREHAAND